MKEQREAEERAADARGFAQQEEMDARVLREVVEPAHDWESRGLERPVIRRSGLDGDDDVLVNPLPHALQRARTQRGAHDGADEVKCICEHARGVMSAAACAGLACGLCRGGRELRVRDLLDAALAAAFLLGRLLA